MSLSYPTDLSDEQWSLIEPLLSAAKPGGGPCSVDLRRILDAMLYILIGGIAW